MPWLNQLVMMCVARARAVQQIAVARDDAARAGELRPTGADQRPNQAHRRARHRAAADADGIAVAHERNRLLERDDLLAQAAVALRQIFASVSRKAEPRSCCRPAVDLGVELLDQAIPNRDAGRPGPARKL